jgi:YidC/Oxa1 family membrane protein insertase
MEKRTVIAIALSIMVLLIWTRFVSPPPPPPAPETTAPVEQVQTTQEITAEEKQPEPLAQIPSTVPALADMSAVVATGNDIVIETDLYKAVLSTKGAVIRHWELKNYKNNDGMPVVLLEEADIISPLAILFENSNRDLPQQVIYNASSSRIVLSENGRNEGVLTFTYENQGVSITKRLKFYNDDYRVDISIETANTPDFMLPVGTNFGIFDLESSLRTHAGPILLMDTSLEKFDAEDTNKYLTGNIHWVANEDKYFTSAIMPITPVIGASFWTESGKPEIAYKYTSGKQDVVLFAGPKEYDRLKNLGMGLEHIIDFGWFTIIAMPLFWFLKFLYSFLGNYGWAIVIMTILVRLPFIPILQKSQQSMKKMQKIQPLMAEIKEKYKKDPQKQQKETMLLYKKHKVNPIGGCLPMLLQIPVFIALYNVLLQAIELRGAPFIFWVTDLAVKDPFYVLPIVMGATMVLQQKMTPTTADPTQAKIMMFLPIIFTVMFLTFPSGLVIYWLVNNVLAIIQQYFVNKKAA